MAMLAGSSGRKHRVLVVDDYPNAADMIASLLSRMGHEARSCLTGQAALDVATDFDPTVVLLDLRLPDISGYEVARYLRARARHVHLAAVTGSDRVSDVRSAFDAGFDQHVVKPVDAAGLRRLLAIAENQRGFG